MKIHWHVFVTILLFGALIVSGGYIYQNIEGWSRIDSIYFTVITITTIGYGDFAPQTDIGKIFTIFFSFFGIALAFYLISMIGSNLFKRHISNRTSQIEYHLKKKEKEVLKESKKHIRAGIKASLKRKRSKKKK